MMTPSLIKAWNFHLAPRLQSQKSFQRVLCSLKGRERFCALHFCYLALSVLLEFVTKVALQKKLVPFACHGFIK